MVSFVLATGSRWGSLKGQFRQSQEGFSGILSACFLNLGWNLQGGRLLKQICYLATDYVKVLSMFVLRHT